jgi:hypothetical protein
MSALPPRRATEPHFFEPGRFDVPVFGGFVPSRRGGRREGGCGAIEVSVREKEKAANDLLLSKKPGGVLLSQGVSPQVPSARAGLTAVFGMGTGVSPPPWPPETYMAGQFCPDLCQKGRRRAPSLKLSIASTSKDVLQALGRLVPVS